MGISARSHPLSRVYSIVSIFTCRETQLPVETNEIGNRDSSFRRPHLSTDTNSGNGKQPTLSSLGAGYIVIPSITTR
jgi:hypothetical protein